MKSAILSFTYFIITAKVISQEWYEKGRNYPYQYPYTPRMFYNHFKSNDIPASAYEKYPLNEIPFYQDPRAPYENLNDIYQNPLANMALYPMNPYQNSPLNEDASMPPVYLNPSFSEAMNYPITSYPSAINTRLYKDIQDNDNYKPHVGYLNKNVPARVNPAQIRKSVPDINKTNLNYISEEVTDASVSKLPTSNIKRHNLLERNLPVFNFTNMSTFSPQEFPTKNNTNHDEMELVTLPSIKTIFVNRNPPVPENNLTTVPHKEATSEAPPIYNNLTQREIDKQLSTEFKNESRSFFPNENTSGVKLVDSKKQVTVSTKVPQNNNKIIEDDAIMAPSTVSSYITPLDKTHASTPSAYQTSLPDINYRDNILQYPSDENEMNNALKPTTSSNSMLNILLKCNMSAYDEEGSIVTTPCPFHGPVRNYMPSHTLTKPTPANSRIINNGENTEFQRTTNAAVANFADYVPSQDIYRQIYKDKFVRGNIFQNAFLTPQMILRNIQTHFADNIHKIYPNNINKNYLSPLYRQFSDGLLNKAQQKLLPRINYPGNIKRNPFIPSPEMYTKYPSSSPNPDSYNAIEVTPWKRQFDPHNENKAEAKTNEAPHVVEKLQKIISRLVDSLFHNDKKDNEVEVSFRNQLADMTQNIPSINANEFADTTYKSAPKIQGNVMDLYQGVGSMDLPDLGVLQETHDLQVKMASIYNLFLNFISALLNQIQIYMPQIKSFLQ